MEEFQQRLDATFAAKTDLDLARITADLPHVPAFSTAWPPPQPRASARGSSGGSDGAGGPGSWRMRSRAWATVNLALVVVAMILIVDLVRPFGWLGAFIPKPLLILLAILVFVRQGIRRVLRGGWPIRPRGRGQRF